jgi:SPP1 family predicted phage head-tail adaptor
MRAGQLRHRLTVQQGVVSGQNAAGEDIKTWTEVGTFWCRIEPLQGREAGEAQQRWAEARHKITMRKQPGVTLQPKMRGIWGSRTLDILDVEDPGGIRPSLTLYARDYNETSA